MQSSANFSFFFFFKLRVDRKCFDLISPRKQLNNNKRLNNNIKFLITNKTRSGISSQTILNLISRLINFNKQILNEKLGKSVKILGGLTWGIRSFL